MAPKLTTGVFFALFSLPASGQQSSPESRLEFLQGLRLEDILVTSVSKKPERAFDAPAAVFVITGEDIRRSGARNIADALRLAPGVQVANLDANKWAVSIRGFADRFANKLLVLIDGRTIYTPNFSGTIWGMHNPPLEDIDRIEVIRGPGGTLWGANAVNGVINIITKEARETDQTFVTGGGGTQEAFGSARYGQKVGDHGHLRAFVDWSAHSPFPLSNGDDGPDDWNRVRGGLRSDWYWEANQLTGEAEYLSGSFGQNLLEPTFAPPYQRTLTGDLEEKEGFVLGRWKHLFPDDTELILQSYYNRIAHDSPTVNLVEKIYDLDFQHRVRLPWKQEVIYGLGYRLYMSAFANHYPLVTFNPAVRRQQLVSGFVHNEITLVEDRLKLILGSKLEHHEFTGLEVQPDARLLWTPHTQHTLWAAVSRAVRTPSRAERDIEITLLGYPDPTSGAQVFPQGRGSSAFKSEELLAYEMGYRALPSKHVNFDVSAFYFDYDKLGVVDLGQPPIVELSPGSPHVILPIPPANAGSGNTYGFETSLEFEPAEGLRLRLGYSRLEKDLAEAPFVGGSKDPTQQGFGRLSWDLPHHLEFDVWGRYVDRIAALAVPDYLECDVRLAWRPRKYLELALVGQNLVHSKHREFGLQGSATSVITEVPRSMYALMTWRF